MIRFLRGGIAVLALLAAGCGGSLQPPVRDIRPETPTAACSADIDNALPVGAQARFAPVPGRADLVFLDEDASSVTVTRPDRQRAAHCLESISDATISGDSSSGNAILSLAVYNYGQVEVTVLEIVLPDTCPSFYLPDRTQELADGGDIYLAPESYLELDVYFVPGEEPCQTLFQVYLDASTLYPDGRLVAILEDGGESPSSSNRE